LLPEICPVCSGGNFKIYLEVNDLIKIVMCSQCGLLINRNTKKGHAGYERLDDVAYEQSIGLVRREQAKAIITIVAELQNRQLSEKYWLDIGCGTGNLLQEAMCSGYQVFGVEPDKKAFDQASSLIGPERMHLGLMEDSVLPDNSFDIISTLDVLEHISPSELINFTRLIYSKLKHGGIWIIKVPTKDGLFFQLAHLLVRIIGSPIYNIIRRLWLIDYEAPHNVYFNIASLSRLLSQQDFSPIFIKHIEEIPNKTVVSRMLIDPTISKIQAYILAPGFYLINFIEKIRHRSDSLLVLAQKKTEQ